MVATEAKRKRVPEQSCVAETFNKRYKSFLAAAGLHKYYDAEHDDALDAVGAAISAFSAVDNLRTRLDAEEIEASVSSEPRNNAVVRPSPTGLTCESLPPLNAYDERMLLAPTVPEGRVEDPQTLLNVGANFNVREPNNGRTVQHRPPAECGQKKIMKALMVELGAAVDALDARPRSPKCAGCGATSRKHPSRTKLLRCGGCLAARYCSQECRSGHWTKVHHRACERHAATPPDPRPALG